MESISFTLPYPPSVNHYYRKVGARVLISRGGREYRASVKMAVIGQRVKPHSEPVSVSVLAYPPDNRRRDLDNLCKALLDALVTSGVLSCDSCKVLRKLSLEWREVVAGGKVTLTIEPCV